MTVIEQRLYENQLAIVRTVMACCSEALKTGPEAVKLLAQCFSLDDEGIKLYDNFMKGNYYEN